jgi:hypothetical protein
VSDNKLLGMPSTPVFISSTFSDLLQYRQSVIEVIVRLQLVVEGMEYFGASPETPKELCLDRLRKSQFYILVVAMKYGSIDPETGKSFTQLEYEEAQRIGIPTLVYLIDEEKQPVLPKDVEFGEGAKKLRQFKDQVLTKHGANFFTSPHDLSAKISQDLPKLVEENGQFVNRGELTRLTEELPRADWINDEVFEFLKKKTLICFDNVPSDILLRELMEFLFVGDRMSAAYLLSRKGKTDLLIAINQLMEMEKTLWTIVKIEAERIHEKKTEQYEDT